MGFFRSLSLFNEQKRKYKFNLSSGWEYSLQHNNKRRRSIQNARENRPQNALFQPSSNLAAIFELNISSERLSGVAKNFSRVRREADVQFEHQRSPEFGSRNALKVRKLGAAQRFSVRENRKKDRTNGIKGMECRLLVIFGFNLFNSEKTL